MASKDAGVPLIATPLAQTVVATATLTPTARRADTSSSTPSNSKKIQTPGKKPAGSGLRLPQFLGYAAGDAANNLAFSMSSMFLLLYYTDVVGITPAAAGTLFLVVRIWDAFADIYAGRQVDKAMTRWGKFRPFILFGSLPLLLLSVATFTVPGGLGGTGKLIYAYLTYALLGLAYSLVNIPYGSLASAMTQVPEERAKLASFRSIGSALTMIMLAFIVAPQINNSDNLQQSLTLTTLLFVVIGFGLYLTLFKTARENVVRDVAQVSLKQSFQTLRSNRPLMMLCVSALMFLIGMFSLQTVQAYYARDVLGDANMFIVLTVVSVGAMLLVAPFIPRIVRYVGKKPAYITASIITIIGSIGVAISPPETPVYAIISFAIYGIGMAAVNTLMWAFEADTVEYGEWRSGIRTEGTTYAVFSFVRKLGQAVGGAAAAYALGFIGYAATAETQSPETLDGIRMIAGFVPAVFITIGTLIMLRYPLTEKVFGEMIADVKRRREETEAASTES
jgi:glucuronide carrier protein